MAKLTVNRTWKGSTKQGRAVIEEVLRSASYIRRTETDLLTGEVVTTREADTELARQIIHVDLKGAKLYEMSDDHTWIYLHGGGDTRSVRYEIDTTGMYIYATEEA